MKTLIEFKNNNIYIRHISALHTHFLVVLIIIVGYFSYGNYNHITSDDIWLGLILFFVIIFNIYQFKIYIVKIILHDNEIIMDYYSWFKLKTIKLDRLSTVVQLKATYPHSHKIEFYTDGKKIITQYGKYKLSLSEWKDDILCSTFKELNEFIKNIQ